MGTAWADGLVLDASPKLSSDGSVRLSWSVPAGGSVDVQRDSQPAFSSPTTLYQGADGASVITGLNDGEYYFRARYESADGHLSDWSDTVAVTVRHHSLTRAAVFFAVGAVVFLSTLLLIVTAARGQETSA